MTSRILLGLAFGWHLGFGLADATSNPIDVLALVEHGGSLVILAWVVYFVLTKTVPSIQADNRESREHMTTTLAAIQQGHASVIERINESTERRNARTSDALDRLSKAVEESNRK